MIAYYIIIGLFFFSMVGATLFIQEIINESNDNNSL